MTTTTTLNKASFSEAKAVHQQKVKAELNKLNAQIDELKAKADRAKADATVEYSSLMEELYAKRDAAELKLQELQQAGEDAWQEMQNGFDQAWNELNRAFNAAVAKFE